MKFMGTKFNQMEETFIKLLKMLTGCEKEQAKLWCFQVKNNLCRGFDHLLSMPYKITNFSGDDFNFTSMHVRPQGDRNWNKKYDVSKMFIHDGIYMFFAMSILNDYENHRYHSFQESLKENALVRAFLDIDSNTPLLLTDVDSIVDEFATEINKRYYIKDDSILRYYTMENNSAPNKKYHIHFPRLVIKKNELVEIVKVVKQNLPSLAQYIDSNYSGCRTLYNVKCDPVTKAQLPNNIYKVDDNCSVYEKLLAIFATRVRAFETWQKPLELKEEYEKEARKKVEHEPITDEVLKCMLDLAENYPEFTVSVEDNFVNLKRKCPSHCPICDRVHHSENMFMSYNNFLVKLHCHRAREEGLNAIVICDLKNKLSDATKKTLNKTKCFFK